MKAKEFNAHPSYNVFTGGQRHSFDEYNREYKKVRYKSAEEFASRNVKEYHHYSETKDLTADDRRDEQVTGAAGAMQMSRALRMKSVADKRRRVLQQVICLVAGSTIIVSTYQAMMNRELPPENSFPAVVQTQEQDENTEPETTVPEEETTTPEAVSFSPKWVWSSDNKTVTLELYDSDGELVHQIPATVSVSTKEPSCNKEGLKTYTASASYDDETYSDTRTEALSPLGHSFDDGKEVTLDNGGTAMVFECERCHEQFTIANSTAEND